jgi:hypothetical protein
MLSSEQQTVVILSSVHLSRGIPISRLPLEHLTDMPGNKRGLRIIGRALRRP